MQGPHGTSSPRKVCGFASNALDVDQIIFFEYRRECLQRNHSTVYRRPKGALKESSCAKPWRHGTKNVPPFREPLNVLGQKPAGKAGKKRPSSSKTSVMARARVSVIISGL